MQKTNKTAPVVEGGILAAVAIVFALISVYIPMLGVIVNMIWPVPFLLLGVRHGIKASLLCLAAAGAIIAMLINPLQALSVVVGFGFIGVALGYAIHKNFRPLRAIFIGTLASFLSKIAVLILAFYMMGFDPLAMQFEAMTTAIDQAVEMYRSFGLTEDTIAQMRQTMEATVAMLKYVMPAGFFLAAVLDTFINYTVAKKILVRMGTYMPDFPPFKNWDVPIIVLWIYTFSMMGVTYFYQTPQDPMYTISVNVQIITMLALVFQGLFFVTYFIDKKGYPKFLRTIIIFLALANSIFVQMLVFIGAFDMVFDLRKIRKPKA